MLVTQFPKSKWRCCCPCRCINCLLSFKNLSVITKSPSLAWHKYGLDWLSRLTQNSKCHWLCFVLPKRCIIICWAQNIFRISLKRLRSPNTIENVNRGLLLFDLRDEMSQFVCLGTSKDAPWWADFKTLFRFFRIALVRLAQVLTWIKIWCYLA